MYIKHCVLSINLIIIYGLKNKESGSVKIQLQRYINFFEYW